MLETDIKDYIDICVHLGAYHELIQGSGGNFSLKNKDEIIIKSSGRVLAETTNTTNTTNTTGYVICSISKLKECCKDSSISIQSTVLGGELQGTPSMEVFFHLLPYKWVVHIHPTYFLPYLCQLKWKSLQSSYPCSYIPYMTPGKDLGLYILDQFKNEQVLFLQNHGIIVCGSTIEEILTILDDLYNLNINNVNCNLNNDNEFIQSYKFKKYIEKQTSQEIVVKPCKYVKNLVERVFFPITPDISLFLKHGPLIQEHNDESIEKLFDEYYKKYKIIPSVVRLGNRTYILGKSYHQCVSIEEILESYIEIITNCDTSTLIYFDENKIKTIASSDNEIRRLNMK